ncbi:hypothetical protein ACN47E_002729 [Coniothyrium glycines]
MFEAASDNDAPGAFNICATLRPFACKTRQARRLKAGRSFWNGPKVNTAFRSDTKRSPSKHHAKVRRWHEETYIITVAEASVKACLPYAFTPYDGFAGRLLDFSCRGLPWRVTVANGVGFGRQWLMRGASMT